MGEGDGSHPRGPPRRLRSRRPPRRAAQCLLLRILKHAEGHRSGKQRRGLPHLLAAVGGTRGVEADGGGAGAGAASIPGPIAGAVAVVEVERVAALGWLLGCGGTTLYPPTPP